MLSELRATRRRSSRWFSALERPLSAPWRVLAWIVATVIFIWLTQLSGGLTSSDANVSVYAAWSMAHGHLSCAYLQSGVVGYAPTAPIYPLFSTAMVALFRLGHGVPFPTQAQLGSHCVTATAAMNKWALLAHVWSPTLRIGFVGWLALSIGVVVLLRSGGRGGTVWEPVTLLLLACAPPVAMCLFEFFHPQDLIALGLALGGVAFVRRDRWVLAGVLLGLAIISQQFALLVFAPLLVLVPPRQFIRFVGASVLSIAVVSLPLIVFTSGRAITSVLVGTGESSASASILYQTGIYGTPMYIVSRFLPIALAIALAWWADHRLGAALREPVPLVSLLATALAFRLIFEVNVWGYYFMALTVMLIVLDVIRGRLRASVVAWVVLLSVVGHYYLTKYVSHPFPPVWAWQLILVSSGVALAVSPLLLTIRENREVAALVHA